MSKFLITGCPRSGTKYTAKLLTSAGIPTGHEKVYRPRGPFPWKLDGEVSWAAVPYLKELKWTGTPVIHQVRHPLKVIASLMQRGTFTSKGQKQWASIATDWMGKVVDGKDPLWVASYFWLVWNLEVEKWAEDTFRIEDEPHLLVNEAAWASGEEWPNIDKALAVPKDVNRSTQQPPTLTYSSLPHDLSGPIRELACKYGYRETEGSEEE